MTICLGTRKDGAPCRATALRGEAHCVAHHPIQQAECWGGPVDGRRMTQGGPLNWSLPVGVVRTHDGGLAFCWGGDVPLSDFDGHYRLERGPADTWRWRWHQWPARVAQPRAVR